jgi:hypothetical protein
MLRLLDPTFALAGLALAAVPVVIHLLNRRRYRVVEWAAMDFLREALQRHRRLIQLRDLLLLALRTLCLLLFGLAMARPYFSRDATTTDPGQPVHAVVVLDNSLSMGYQRLDGTLLDEAKSRALDFLERLPPGSRFSIVPLCGSATAFSRQPLRTLVDARDALHKIEIVDRSASAVAALDLARDAASRAPDLPTKRMVFVGDQQSINWPTGAVAPAAADPLDMQLVPIGDSQSENAWIDDFRLQDGIADVDSRAVFVVTLRYEGTSPRSAVPIALTVDGVEVATQTVDLEPGQSREVQFEHTFDVPVDPGDTQHVPCAVAMPADRLPADDQRFLVAPVVAALPVVFVDQLGDRDENPQRNRYGESFHLRRLLAPVTSRLGSQRQLVKVHHVTIEDVDQRLLEDARLVVIAGVERPDAALTLLSEYVQQGGQLLIAAGGDFDPAAWTRTAWLDGVGLLPLPLQAEPIGHLPDQSAGQLEPLQLEPASLIHDYFQLGGVPQEERDDLYRLPVFFKIVGALDRPEVLQTLRQNLARQHEEIRDFLAQANARRDDIAKLRGQREPTAAEQQALDADEARRKELEPDWLTWAALLGVQRGDDAKSPDEIARLSEPRVLARFSTGNWPFLIERNIGRGRVVFAASGITSAWNNLTRTNAVLVFDRILRAMLEQTVPRRNFEAVETIALAIDPSERQATFKLTRPNGWQETLAVDALGSDQFVATIRHVTERGHYHISAWSSSSTAGQPPSETKLWDQTLAVNGSPRESDLRLLDERGLRQRVGEARVHWVPPGDEIPIEGGAVSGHDLWKILMLAVLVALLAELLVLGHRTKLPLAPVGGEGTGG